MNNFIEILNLKKVFGSGDSAVHAFGPIDINIQEGEFISFLGPSGCGKSTLMLMIAGLLPITNGKIMIEGKDVYGPKTDIGIMFQDSTLVPWRTVRGNIELQLEMRGEKIENYREKINDLLNSVSMIDFAERYPPELSGGMQQRAGFCQTMVHSPKTMLLDEPLGKLDAMTREKIRADFQFLWMKAKPTVIFVTHSIEEAVQLSTKIAIITPRPGLIDQIIDIELPYPRNIDVKKSSKFTDYVRRIEGIFHEFKVI